jgi:hypothetical protein
MKAMPSANGGFPCGLAKLWLTNDPSHRTSVILPLIFDDGCNLKFQFFRPVLREKVRNR